MGLILVSASAAIGFVRVSEKCIKASYVAECISIICNYSQLAISSHQIAGILATHLLLPLAAVSFAVGLGYGLASWGCLIRLGLRLHDLARDFVSDCDLQRKIATPSFLFQRSS